MMITTFPTTEQLKTIYEMTPDSMWPEIIPHAVILEGYLNDLECDQLLESAMRVTPHTFPGCKATTTEFVRPIYYGELKGVDDAAFYFNKVTWGYELDDRPHAWLQSYEAGDSYALHTDTAAGQSRKLTAIVQLSDDADYAGGNTYIYAYPHRLKVPKKRGTIVVFQPWLPHEVSEVIQGVRQSLNVGFYGPSFK